MDVILLAIALGGLKAALTTFIRKRAAIAKIADEDFALREAQETLPGENAPVVSLCSTCASAHIVTGFRDSERVVICTESEPHVPIRFEVKECTEYSNRNRPAPAAPPRVHGFFVDESTASEEERETVAAGS